MKPELSLRERLELGGNLTVRETIALANVGVTKFYDDLKKGRVRILKYGAKSVVTAPVAKAYIAGEPLPPKKGAVA